MGWVIGLIGFGLVFGALSDQIGGLQGEATEWYSTFGGDVDLLGAYWASMMQMGGMAIAICVTTLLLRLHHDEAQGEMEAVLGTAVSRVRWLGAYAVNALVGSVVLLLVFAAAMAFTGGQVLGGTGSLLRDLIGAALIQLPAISVLAAAVVTVIMLLPRWSVGLTWALVVGSIVAGPMFGPALGLPQWLLDLSPFTHVPNAPAVAPTIEPILGLCLTSGLLAAAAVVSLRRRNLTLPV